MSFVTATPLPALVLMLSTAVALTGCSVSLDLGDDATTRTEREVVAVDAHTRIEVNTANGEVTVRSAETDEIEIVATLREADEGDATYRIETDDDAVIVTGECDGGWLDPCSVGFEIDVPADLDVTVATDNGAIELDRIAGRVDLETDNGAIDAVALRSDDIRASTDNGAIDLDVVAPPDSVDAHTDNGAVTVRLPDDGVAYDVDADSDNGSVSIDVRTDPESDRRIVIRTDNGRIDVAPGD